MLKTNKIYYFKLFIMLAANLTLSSPIRYFLNEINENSATISFSLDSRSYTVLDNTFSFAYSCLPNTNDKISIYLLSQPNISITIFKTVQGWFGNNYLRWVVFSLPESITRSHNVTTINGYIKIKFDITSSVNKAVLRNGILYIEKNGPPLTKSFSNTLPYIPYRHGVKIEVVSDGIYSISGEKLRRLGVPIATIPSKNYRLFFKGKEIPIYLSNPSRPVMQPNDEICFYARGLRGENTYYSQFSNSAIYWLTWDGGVSGSRVAQATGQLRRSTREYRPPEQDSTELLARKFSDTLHIEFDNDIRWLSSIEQQQPEEMSQTVISDSLDNWYWGFIGDQKLTNYSLLIPSPLQNSNLRARMKIGIVGLTNVDGVIDDHKYSILLNNKAIEPADAYAVWDGQKEFIYVTNYFPSTILQHGQNILSFLKDDSRPFEDRAALNWVKIEYTRTFMAYDNYIEFKNEPTNQQVLTQFVISNFTDPNIELWDITNYRKFGNFEVRQSNQSKSNPSYILVFQDSTDGSNRYLAQALLHRQNPLSISLDTVYDNFDNLSEVDYIIVAPDSFFSILQGLANMYRTMGLDVAIVNINHIYNRFSFGIRNPESIREMLKFVFSRTAKKSPRYLLLAGDTTHDLDKKNRHRNIIPTHLERIPGWGPGASDDYFALAKGNDLFTDLYVGRFPAENKEQLQTLVTKTTSYHTNLTKGYWKDNLLLLGGFEPVFTKFNYKIQQDVIRDRANVIRMDADTGSIYYKHFATASRSIIDWINAGVYAINFNGHGGGNIWSDSRFFSYSDLYLLHNSQWGSSGKLPIIFSFTCLTGFFESSFYRSLGEEFIRSGPNGAICFYGASAYASQKGDIYLNTILLDLAYNGSVETVGELIWLAEMNMLVRHGPSYLSLVRQYNLLGDPALPWRLTPDTLKLSLRKSSLAGTDTLTVDGSCMPVADGQVKLQVYANNNKWSENIVKVKNGMFNHSFPIKKDARTSSGIIRAYAWNNGAEVRGIAQFSKDSITVHSIAISPAKPSFGDSVEISCRITIPSAFTITPQVFCVFQIAPSTQQHMFGENGILMEFRDDSLWVSSKKIVLNYPGTIEPLLYVKILLSDINAKISKESSVFAFPIAGRPDLCFTNSTLTPFWLEDSIRCNIEVLNAGNMPASDFKIIIGWGETPQINPIFILSSGSGITPGKTQKFTFSLPDTSGEVAFSAYIQPNEISPDITLDNNTAQGILRITYVDCSTSSDTLWSNGKALALYPAHNFETKKRVFLLHGNIKEDKPLPTLSKWISLKKDSISSFKLGARPPLEPLDTILWCFRISEDSTTTTLTKHKISDSLYSVFIYDSSYSRWRALNNLTTTLNGIIKIGSTETGPFAVGVHSDNTQPDIRVSVAGRNISYLDYTAKDKPFIVFLRDLSGIVPSSVSLTLNGGVIDSSEYSQCKFAANLSEFSITLYPRPSKVIDTLVVSATDFAGNKVQKAFAYLPGEKLSIKFFDCYPNPFSAKQDKNGKTIEPIRLAFLLTDMADEVIVSIYSIGGRKINTWKISRIIGYHEIEWDGKSADGYRLANGTYYAKLVARAAGVSAQKIITIAKLEGYY